MRLVGTKGHPGSDPSFMLFTSSRCLLFHLSIISSSILFEASKSISSKRAYFSLLLRTCVVTLIYYSVPLMVGRRIQSYADLNKYLFQHELNKTNIKYVVESKDCGLEFSLKTSLASEN